MATIWPGIDAYALTIPQKLSWSANLRSGFLPPRRSALKALARSVAGIDDLNRLAAIVNDCDDDASAEVAFSGLWRMSGCFSYLDLLRRETLERRPSYFLDAIITITEDIWDETEYSGAARILSFLKVGEDASATRTDPNKGRSEEDVVRFLLSRDCSIAPARKVWMLKQYAGQQAVYDVLRSWSDPSLNALIFRVLAHWTAATDLTGFLEGIDELDSDVSILLLNAAAVYSIRIRKLDPLETAYARVSTHVPRSSFEELRGYVAVHVVSNLS